MGHSVRQRSGKGQLDLHRPGVTLSANPYRPALRCRLVRLGTDAADRIQQSPGRFVHPGYQLRLQRRGGPCHAGRRRKHCCRYIHPVGVRYGHAGSLCRRHRRNGPYPVPVYPHQKQHHASDSRHHDRLYRLFPHFAAEFLRDRTPS